MKVSLTCYYMKSANLTAHPNPTISTTFYSHVFVSGGYMILCVSMEGSDAVIELQVAESLCSVSVI